MFVDKTLSHQIRHMAQQSSVTFLFVDGDCLLMTDILDINVKVEIASFPTLRPSAVLL